MSALRETERYREYQQVAIPTPEEQEEQIKKVKRSKEQQLEKRKKIRLAKNIIVMVCVFSLLSVVVYRSSVISANNMEYIKVEEAISKKQMQIRDMKLQIAEKEDLAHVRQVAQDELKMKAPDKGQVKYIDKEQPETAIELTDDKSVWESIIDGIADFFNAVKSWLQ